MHSGRWDGGRFEPDPPSFGGRPGFFGPDDDEASPEDLPAEADEAPPTEGTAGQAAAGIGTTEEHTESTDGEDEGEPFVEDEGDGDGESPFDAAPGTPESTLYRVASVLLPVAAVLVVAAAPVLARTGGAIPTGPVAGLEEGLADTLSVGVLPVPFAPFIPSGLPQVPTVVPTVEPPVETEEAPRPPTAAGAVGGDPGRRPVPHLDAVRPDDRRDVDHGGEDHPGRHPHRSGAAPGDRDDPAAAPHGSAAASDDPAAAPHDCRATTHDVGAAPSDDRAAASDHRAAATDHRTSATDHRTSATDHRASATDHRASASDRDH